MWGSVVFVVGGRWLARWCSCRWVVIFPCQEPVVQTDEKGSSDDVPVGHQSQSRVEEPVCCLLRGRETEQWGTVEVPSEDSRRANLRTKIYDIYLLQVFVVWG